MLDGDNVFTSNKVVLLARIDSESAVETNDWKEFNLPFKPVNGKQLTT